MAFVWYDPSQPHSSLLSLKNTNLVSIPTKSNKQFHNYGCSIVESSDSSKVTHKSFTKRPFYCYGAYKPNQPLWNRPIATYGWIKINQYSTTSRAIQLPSGGMRLKLFTVAVHALNTLHFHHDPVQEGSSTWWRWVCWRHLSSTLAGSGRHGWWSVWPPSGKFIFNTGIFQSLQ